MRSPKMRPQANEGSGKPCCYCGRIMIPTGNASDKNPIIRGLVSTVDHIIPQSHGGDNHRDNLVFACARDNSLKGSINHQIFEMFGQRILKMYPNAPTIYLRSALMFFMTQLAEIAIKNKRESKSAISRTMSHLQKELKKVGEL